MFTICKTKEIFNYTPTSEENNVLIEDRLEKAEGFLSVRRADLILGENCEG
jgi:hypothetical protein